VQSVELTEMAEDLRLERDRAAMQVSKLSAAIRLAISRAREQAAIAWACESEPVRYMGKYVGGIADMLEAALESTMKQTDGVRNDEG